MGGMGRSMVLFQRIAGSRYACACSPLCLNSPATEGQVTADFSANSAAVPSFLNSSNNSVLDVQPALGLSWSNCVHTRFLLTRRDQQGGGSSSHFVRQMRLVLSPSLPSDLACQFKVEAGGVKGVGPAAAQED